MSDEFDALRNEAITKTTELVMADFEDAVELMRARLRYRLSIGSAARVVEILTQAAMPAADPPAPVVEVIGYSEGRLRRSSAGASGYDLTAGRSNEIPPGCSALFWTGVAVSMPPGIEAQVRSRSGHAARGLVVQGGVGTIDSDYRGQIQVVLKNMSMVSAHVSKGERIAQLVFVPVIHPNFHKVQRFTDKTERGDGGFGSTGK